MKAFVINRKKDTGRLAHFEAQVDRQVFDVEIIEAIDGHSSEFDINDYPFYLRDHWFGYADFKLGAFACFLSHMKTWKRFLDSGEPCAAIFEDDAAFVGDPSNLTDEALHGNDILFVNYRTTTWLKGLERKAPSVSVRDAVTNVITHNYRFGEVIRHPGADAYILTRKAAQALVEKVDETGICFGLDWFLICASLGNFELPDGYQRYHVFSFLRPLVGGNLNGAILWDYFVQEAYAASESTIDHNKKVDIATLRAQKD